MPVKCMYYARAPPDPALELGSHICLKSLSGNPMVIAVTRALLGLNLEMKAEKSGE